MVSLIIKQFSFVSLLSFARCLDPKLLTVAVVLRPSDRLCVCPVDPPAGALPLAMYTRQLVICLRRTTARTPTTAHAPTQAPAAGVLALDWSIQASQSGAHRSPDAAHEPPPTDALSRAALWAMTKAALAPSSDPRQRQRRLRSLSQTLAQEANARGRVAVAEGQAWMDAGAPGSLQSRLKWLTAWMLARIDRREEVLREVHGFMQGCVAAAAAARATEVETRRQQPAADTSSLNADTSSSTPTQAATATAVLAPASEFSTSPLARITFRHPSDLSSADARSSVLSFLAARSAYHARWQTINLVLLPLTSAAFIVPGPNVFLAWNAFRLYGHWTAGKAARQMEECIQGKQDGKTAPAIAAGRGGVAATMDANSEEVALSPVDVLTVEFAAYQPGDADALCAVALLPSKR